MWIFVFTQVTFDFEFPMSNSYSRLQFLCTQFVWSMNKKVNGNGILVQQQIHWHLKIITNYSLFKRKFVLCTTQVNLLFVLKQLRIRRKKNRSVSFHLVAFSLCNLKNFAAFLQSTMEMNVVSLSLKIMFCTPHSHKNSIIILPLLMLASTNYSALQRKKKKN